MSKETTYNSRSVTVACGPGDLYAFLTDMRNFETIIPVEKIKEWEADEIRCSFRVDHAGKINASLAETVPHSAIDYLVETYITGKITAHVAIEPVDHDRSRISISVSAHLNPFVKMAVGDAPEKYLEMIITAVENYNGYDRIRGDIQSP
jgi:carbon monoxide dehydrogenase subunit G